MTKQPICKSSIILGAIISPDSILRGILQKEESRHKYANMCAKFTLNDLMGMLKKKKKKISEAPPEQMKLYLLAYYYEVINRNQLRQYVDALI